MPEERDARFAQQRLAATFVSPVPYGGRKASEAVAVARGGAATVLEDTGANEQPPADGGAAAAAAADAGAGAEAEAVVPEPTDPEPVVPEPPPPDDEGEEGPPDDEEIVAARGPIQGWQYASFSDDSVVWNISMELRADEARPNGVVVAQAIPEGWTITSSDPPIQKLEGDGRTAKWLLVGDATAGGNLIVVASGPGGASAWRSSGGWYSYVDAQGRSHKVALQPHPGSGTP